MSIAEKAMFVAWRGWSYGAVADYLTKNNLDSFDDAICVIYDSIMAEKT